MLEALKLLAKISIFTLPIAIIIPILIMLILKAIYEIRMVLNIREDIVKAKRYRNSDEYQVAYVVARLGRETKGFLARKWSINTLIKILQDPKAPVGARASAAGSLGMIGIGKNTQLALESVARNSEEERYIRMACIFSLSSLRMGIETIITIIKDTSDLEMSELAIMVIARYNNPKQNVDFLENNIIKSNDISDTLKDIARRIIKILNDNMNPISAINTMIAEFFQRVLIENINIPEGVRNFAKEEKALLMKEGEFASELV